MAGDANAGVYDHYAKQFIPGNVVIGANGRILFQSIGFEEKKFKRP